MKKSLLSTGIVLALGAGTANAAFLQPGSSGTIDFTAGCFTFGSCVIGGLGNVTDNAITVRGNGSGVAGDGLVGQVGFTVGADGNTLTITSYQQDTYTGTAGGDFSLEANGGSLAGFSGFISDSGDVSLTLDRVGFPNFFSYLDNSVWNVDNSAAIAGQGDPTTGVLDALTTGSDSAWTPGTPATAVNPLTGSALVAAGSGTWTGLLVNSGNVGAAWGAFDGTPYTEQFEITVNGTAAAPTVPVPAAVWLFGSGLLGLVGVARRRSA